MSSDKINGRELSLCADIIKKIYRYWHLIRQPTAATFSRRRRLIKSISINRLHYLAPHCLQIHYCNFSFQWNYHILPAFSCGRRCRAKRDGWGVIIAYWQSKPHLTMFAHKTRAIAHPPSRRRRSEVATPPWTLLFFTQKYDKRKLSQK